MKLKEGWVITELGGEYVAVPTQESGGDFYGVVRLNETGKDIWQAISEGLSEKEIAERLVELYEGIDAVKANNAVRKFVDKLKEKGLIEE